MRPILVTGAHRSGTTWVGKMLAKAPGVRYIQEPFNIAMNRSHSPIPFWYYYVHDGMPTSQQEEVTTYLDSFSQWHFPQLKQAWKKATSWKGKYYVLADLKNRYTHRTLIKDPLAFFSAPYFYEQLQYDVVICIRHPAAFVASLQQKQWTFDFSQLQQQPNLLNDWLSPYADAIAAQVAHPKDLIAQGILLWNLLYHTAYQFQERYKTDWYFVTHEALSLQPMKEFEQLFTFLQIPWTPRTQQAILASTTSEVTTKLQRDSKANARSWETRLSPAEIQRIKEGTQAVWPYFYTEKDW